MRFGEALAHARNGKRIARLGWNGKNMYVYFSPGRLILVEDWIARFPSQELTEAEKERGYVNTMPRLDMVNAQGNRIIGWLAAQPDVLADDWYVVKEDGQ